MNNELRIETINECHHYVRPTLMLCSGAFDLNPTMFS